MVQWRLYSDSNKIGPGFTAQIDRMGRLVCTRNEIEENFHTEYLLLSFSVVRPMHYICDEVAMLQIIIIKCHGQVPIAYAFVRAQKQKRGKNETHTLRDHILCVLFSHFFVDNDHYND